MKDTFELKLYLRFLGIISSGIAIFLILGIRHHNEVEKTRPSLLKINSEEIERERLKLFSDCDKKVCES